VKWVLVPNGKGGFTPKAERESATTSIALSKSNNKGAGCTSASCCAKH
jgi:hypothetical protein